MRILLQGTALMLCTPGASALSEKFVANDRQTLQQVAQHGVCKSDTVLVKMQNVLKIENRELYSQEPTSLWGSAKLNGNVVEFFDTSGKSIISSNLLNAIDDKSILDVRLNFAIYEGREFLYWEETYENRFKKLGLINFSLKLHDKLELIEPEFSEFCRGGMGTNSSH